MQPIFDHSADTEEYTEKCQLILDWAEENPRRNFDTTFIDSMMIQLSDHRVLSIGQKRAIDHIIDRFEI